MKSELFSLDIQDLSKGAVMAVISGFVLPIMVALQDPTFSIFTADWTALLTLASNGAVMGFVSYLGKQFVSDKEGKVFGKIG